MQMGNLENGIYKIEDMCKTYFWTGFLWATSATDLGGIKVRGVVFGEDFSLRHGEGCGLLLYVQVGTVFFLCFTVGRGKRLWVVADCGGEWRAREVMGNGREQRSKQR